VLLEALKGRFQPFSREDELRRIRPYDLCLFRLLLLSFMKSIRLGRLLLK
jgi:hypothetical protein